MIVKIPATRAGIPSARSITASALANCSQNPTWSVNRNASTASLPSPGTGESSEYFSSAGITMTDPGPHSASPRRALPERMTVTSVSEWLCVAM